MTFVTWKWPSPPGYRSSFGPETVNVLRRMIARHYHLPHRFCCVTHEAKGLDREIEIIPPWNDFIDVPSPSGSHNPSCYRRLRLFDPDIGRVFGPRFVSLDLDVVITGDLELLLDRPEDFVIYADTNPRTFYNGSLVLMTAGARPQVWTTFDPIESPRAAFAASHFGSDQGWISYCLGPGEARFTTFNGVYSFRNHLWPKGLARPRELPGNATVVIFHGRFDPWHHKIRNLEWVKRHYR